MSLLQIRSDWMRLSREAADQAEYRRHVVIGATFTAEPIIPYLGLDLIEDPRKPPKITISPYDQIFQLCHDWRTMFAGDTPDVIIIMWRIEDFLREEFRGFQAGARLDASLAKLEEMASAIAALRRSFEGVLIVSTPPFPHFAEHHIRALGNASQAAAFHRRVVDDWVGRMAEVGGVSLLDLDGLQRYVGIAQAHDARKWYLYHQPFSEVFWREVAADAAALILSQTRAPKKCIVVDCDNTLWGGVIGEDGLEGIALGLDFPGSAFSDFQRQLLALRVKGVMIAISSKNNEADVWDVFDRHDGMILKKDHVVAHRINWADKPSNIKSIANELNIGLDSFVFVDDSPMEIEHVRSTIPEVTCIQVPTDLSALPGVIAGYRGFDREHVSEEDRARSDMMIQERSRKELATNLDGDAFRKALELIVDVFPVRPEHTDRVVQLINKTNQFNLTTRRRSAAELNALLADRNVRVVAWRVSDRFGDYGLVGVAILELADEALRIDTLLMSCRVLGRGVERSVFAAIGDMARQHGVQRLSGEYRPTSKNQLVARLYAEHGFNEVSPGQWLLEDCSSLEWPAEIKRPGL